SFQMIKEGRWLYQQTPHAHVATKPPLVAWISGGLFGLTRSWDLAWRLPSFLAAVALALLLFRSARSAYGLTAGLIAEAAFGVNEWWRRRHAVVAGVGDSGYSHKVQFRQSAWPGWWPWVVSLAVFLAWVIGGILFQPGFFDEVVMREFVGRFGETIHRPQPL